MRLLSEDRARFAASIPSERQDGLATGRRAARQVIWLNQSHAEIPWSIITALYIVPIILVIIANRLINTVFTRIFIVRH